MFKQTLFRSLLTVIVVGILAGLYYSPWLKTEWSILSGKQAFQRGDFQVAVENLSLAVETLEQRSSNRTADLRRILAQSHLALRQDEDALRHYRRIADSKADFVLGLRALQAGEWAVSIDHLRRASETEPNCTVCKSALANAVVAEIAHRTSVEARDIQANALEEMKAPATCLCYLAVVAAGSSVVSSLPIMHPSVVSVARKLGASKQVAEKAMRQLEKQLPKLTPLLKFASSDYCPSLSTNEMVKTALELVDFAPFGSDAYRILVAAEQAYRLAKPLADYGQAFGIESDASSQLASADSLRSAHWEIIVTASKSSTFFDQPLESLSMPAAPKPRGWVMRSWDVVNPANWLSK